MKISKSKIKANSDGLIDDSSLSVTSIFSVGVTTMMMFAPCTAPALPTTIGSDCDCDFASVSTDRFKQWQVADSQSESVSYSSASDALKLQKYFGFNVAQWAALLGVERKTIYNWKKSPQTQLQEKNVRQIEALKVFADEIDQQHAPYMAKLLFGKQADGVFVDAFNQALQSSHDLEAFYDKFYTHIDGFVKRKLREQRSRKA